MRTTVLLLLLLLLSTDCSRAALPLASSRPTPVVACAFSPDGVSLVVARQDGVEVRGVVGGDRRTLDVKLPRIAAIAFDASGQRLAVAGGTPGEAGVAVVWDFKAGKSLARIDGLADLATAVAFSPDGSILAVGSADRTVKLLRLSRKDDMLQPEPAGALVGHGGAVTSLVFSPDGKLVATASIDRSIKVWTVADGALVRTLGNHTDAVHMLAVRPQADPKSPWTVASASDDRTVRVWQPGIGRMVRIVRGHDGPVLAIAWAADGKALLSLGAEGIVRVIEGDGDQTLQKLTAHADWGYTLAVSPDGRHVATGGWAGEVKVGEIDKASFIRPLQAEPGARSN